MLLYFITHFGFVVFEFEVRESSVNWLATGNEQMKRIEEREGERERDEHETIINACEMLKRNA